MLSSANDTRVIWSHGHDNGTIAPHCDITQSIIQPVLRSVSKLSCNKTVTDSQLLTTTSDHSVYCFQYPTLLADHLTDLVHDWPKNLGEEY